MNTTDEKSKQRVPVVAGRRHLGHLALALVCVFALLGILLAAFPDWCFTLPYGFLLNALITGHVPPPYVRFECYEDLDSHSVFREWAHDGDVIVSTMPKGGTTWMLYVTHLIRIKGDEDKFPYHEINTNTLWPSLVYKPGQRWSEIKHLANSTVLSEGIKLKDLWDHDEYPFRIWKAHESPRDEDPLIRNHNTFLLPVRKYPKIKYIAMVRNLPDVLASFYPFPNNHREGFKRLWGSFPPSFKSTQEMFDLIFGYSPFGAPVVEQWLDYARAWWKVKDEPNVLLLHYNDAIVNLPAVVRRIARFVSIDLSDAEVAEISKKGSFANMKKMSQHFNYRLWGAPEFHNGEYTCMEQGTLTRKGNIGDGAASFSLEQVQYSTQSCAHSRIHTHPLTLTHIHTPVAAH